MTLSRWVLGTSFLTDKCPVRGKPLDGAYSFPANVMNKTVPIGTSRSASVQVTAYVLIEGEG